MQRTAADAAPPPTTAAAAPPTTAAIAARLPIAAGAGAAEAQPYTERLLMVRVATTPRHVVFVVALAFSAVEVCMLAMQ